MPHSLEAASHDPHEDRSHDLPVEQTSLSSDVRMRLTWQTNGNNLQYNIMTNITMNTHIHVAT